MRICKIEAIEIFRKVSRKENSVELPSYRIIKIIQKLIVFSLSIEDVSNLKSNPHISCWLNNQNDVFIGKKLSQKKFTLASKNFYTFSFNRNINWFLFFLDLMVRDNVGRYGFDIYLLIFYLIFSNLCK